MRLFLSALLLAAALPAAMGQNTTPAVQDVIPGKVLVKVKPEFKSMFQSGNPSGRSALGAKAIRSLAPGTAAKRKAGRAQALKPVIDITQYFEVSFDPAQPVLQYMESLYATGYVEAIEPEYIQQPLYTPNDAAIGNQYYLEKIRAFEAWDITQGSEDIVIAIIDTGGDLDHPDLASQLYINMAEYPANGIDDDGNGYIDDYRGWDFSGANAGNIVGDNDPSITTNIFLGTHGTAVASCASAATDNGVGKAGVGYKTRLLFTKHFSDNTTSGTYSTDTYLGVLYAALSGAQIINCSWGSFSASTIYQDIITYVSQDLGCLVVAAAGNSASDVKLYPAAYDHVISVAGSTAGDKATWSTCYGHTVDITAPGEAIYIALYNDSYGWDDGTSFAAPIVSGAAALVWAAHPEYTADQVGEQLRVTADPVIYQNSPERAGQLGKGRLDVYAALTLQSPSVRASNARFTNTHNAAAVPGDTILLYLDFKNYLKTTSALQVTITPESTFGTALQNVITPGAIATNGIYTNTAAPFRIKTNNGLGENVTTEVRIDYSDGTYQDYQYVTLVFNPTYVTVAENNIATTVTSAGRIGFGDAQGQTQGVGFLYNGTPLLYEMGLIMGTSASNVLNNVRGTSSNSYDQDFVSTGTITSVKPGSRSDMEVFGAFADNATPIAQTVNVSYRSLVWAQSPNENLVVLEYTIKNPQATALTNFYYGIFADWDISSGGAQDAAGWNAKTRTGYAYAKQNTALPYAGIQLLTADPQYYAIDNNHTLPGNPFGLYDGFSDAEKFTALSTSAKTEAGMTVAGGTDISHVVATGPYTIEPNGEITVAFALLAANNLNDLLATAAHADTLYNLALQAAQPVVPVVPGCIGKDVKITATGASDYKWYYDFTGGNPVATGPAVTIPNFQHDTVLYVSNAKTGYESVRTKVTVTKAASPTAAFTMNTPALQSGVPVQFTDNSTGAGNWAWSFGDNSTSTQQSPQHTYSTGGSYTITLTVTANNNCQDATTQKLDIVTETEKGTGAGISIYPNPVSAGAQHSLNLSQGNTTGKTVTATLATTQGRQLAQTTFAASDENRTLNISGYTPGLYILMLTTGSTTYTYKVLITP